MTSNDPQTPRFILSIAGEVISDVTVQPKRVRFKDLKPAEKATREFSIVLRDPSKVKVTSVTMEDSRFALSHKSGDPEKGAQYEIRFLGSPDAGRISTKVRIQVDGADKPFIDVPVIARISGNLRYQKKLFFTKRKGEYSPKRIKISTRDKSPLHVKKVVDADKLLNIAIEKNRTPAVQIALEVANPGAVGRDVSEHKLVVHTDNKDQSIAEISYRIGDDDVSKFMRGKRATREKRRRGRGRQIGTDSR